MRLVLYQSELLPDNSHLWEKDDFIIIFEDGCHHPCSLAIPPLGAERVQGERCDMKTYHFTNHLSEVILCNL